MFLWLLSMKNRDIKWTEGQGQAGTMARCWRWHGMVTADPCENSITVQSKGQSPCMLGPCSGVFCLGAIAAGSGFQPSLTIKGRCLCTGNITHNRTKQPGVKDTCQGQPPWQQWGWEQRNTLRMQRGREERCTQQGNFTQGTIWSIIIFYYSL